MHLLVPFPGTSQCIPKRAGSYARKSRPSCLPSMTRRLPIVWIPRCAIILVWLSALNQKHPLEFQKSCFYVHSRFIFLIGN